MHWFYPFIGPFHFRSYTYIFHPYGEVSVVLLESVVVLELLDALFEQRAESALSAASGVVLLHPTDVAAPRVQRVRARSAGAELRLEGAPCVSQLLLSVRGRRQADSRRLRLMVHYLRQGFSSASAVSLLHRQCGRLPAAPERLEVLLGQLPVLSHSVRHLDTVLSLTYYFTTLHSSFTNSQNPFPK